MRLRWSEPAFEDLIRLHEFLSVSNPHAATSAARELVAAAERLLLTPRLGRVLDAYRPREVRRLISGPYELRYEVRADDIIVVRLFHGREDRQ